MKRQHGFFALMARMKFINRWGLMKNTMQESICEHSLMTAVLAHALGVIRRDVFGGEIDPDRCAAAAMYHDAPEILTGDLPTPVKYFNPEICNAYKQVEGKAANKLLSMLPDNMKGAYEKLLFCEKCEPQIYEIVKVADKLSAYVKCVEELRSGNNEFKSAADSILKILIDNPLPELKYFMDNFIDYFKLTIDDLEP